jgi:serine/threonine protein kinase
LYSILALKKIPKTKFQKRQHYERVKAEKTILESIRSPFLCRSFGVFDNETHHSFLLEYIEGELLYKCIWSHREGGKFSEEIARFFAVQIVLGVRTLHANGFLHRDLKTGNVIVNKKGFAKIIDFGFAKKLGPSIDSSSSLSTCNRTTSFCGTHYIMAPEIYLRQSYSFEVDWW